MLAIVQCTWKDRISNYMLKCIMTIGIVYQIVRAMLYKISSLYVLLQVLYFVQLTSPTTIASYQANTKNDFAPKHSKQWKWMARMTKGVQCAFARLDQKVSSWDTSKRDRERYKRAERAAKYVHFTAVRRDSKVMALIAFWALCLQAKGKVKPMANSVTFDTDSGRIGVDNRTTGCISSFPSDFKEGTLQPTKRWIKGFNGSRTQNVQTGTLIWK